MKKISIHREKYFTASLNVYDVVIVKDNGEERRLPLKNGDTIHFELDDKDYALSIWYHSFNNKTRFKVTNTYMVKANDTDKELVLDIIGRRYKSKMVLIDRSIRQL